MKEHLFPLYRIHKDHIRVVQTGDGLKVSFSDWGWTAVIERAAKHGLAPEEMVQQDVQEHLEAFQKLAVPSKA